MKALMTILTVLCCFAIVTLLISSCVIRQTAVQPFKITCQATLKGHTAAVSSIAISPDGSLLASGGQDGATKLWSVADRKAIATFAKKRKSIVRSIAFSPDGKLLASTFFEGMIQGGVINLWSVETKKMIAKLKVKGPIQGAGQGINVFSIAFSPDGKLLAGTETWSGVIGLWSIAERKQVAYLRGYWEEYRGTKLESVAFSPDGKFLASGAIHGDIKLWSFETREELATLKGHSNAVTAVAFSPDGKLLASGAENSLKLWDVITHQEVATLKGKVSVAFSPDGRLLASATAGKMMNSIKLWSVETLQEIATLKGHRDTVTAVAFSPDGQLLASASKDSTIKLWKVQNPTPAFGLAQEATDAFGLAQETTDVPRSGIPRIGTFPTDRESVKSVNQPY